MPGQGAAMVAALVAASVPALGLAALAFRRAGRLLPPSSGAEGTVTLLLPATGPLPTLEALVAAIAAGRLPPRRLIVAVESEDDPAFARVSAIMAASPFPIEVRVAGTASWRGQKNTNLLAALAAVDAADDVVVLLDADILPQAWWLSAAASPALSGTADVVTGFRWQSLDGQGLGGHLVAWIDRSVATLVPVLPRPLGPVWGGTIALSRRARAALDLHAILDRRFADDLPIGRAAVRAGLRILVRGAVLLPTPGAGSDRQRLRFLLRQIQSLRFYGGPLFAVLMATAHASVLGWGVALWHLPSATAWAAVIGVGLCGMARAGAMAVLSRRLGAPDRGMLTAVQVAVGAVAPVADALSAWLCWVALARRRVRWGHVEYDVRGPEAVTVVRRSAPGRDCGTRAG